MHLFILALLLQAAIMQCELRIQRGRLNLFLQYGSGFQVQFPIPFRSPDRSIEPSDFSHGPNPRSLLLSPR